MNKKAGVGKIVLIILILVVLLGAVYFTFFFYYSCDDKDTACFKAHQEKCSKTKFLNDNEDALWSYKIKGKENNQCKIYVEFVQAKKGDIELIKLEGKSMDCYLPIGNTNSPESDISKCHGLLKEELQNIIINKLHNYIVKNVGEIGEELNSVPGVSNTNPQTQNQTSTNSSGY